MIKNTVEMKEEDDKVTEKIRSGKTAEQTSLEVTGGCDGTDIEVFLA